MYVAVKGGETAILNSYQLLAQQRRGDETVPELSVTQIRQQLKLAVDRVMTEGSVYDPDLAALAIKQASGDLVEAIFLLRAYRATLPRLGETCALSTSDMVLSRRISATFKDLPGGQVLGATYDYTQRLPDAGSDEIGTATDAKSLCDYRLLGTRWLAFFVTCNGRKFGFHHRLPIEKYGDNMRQ